VAVEWLEVVVEGPVGEPDPHVPGRGVAEAMMVSAALMSAAANIRAASTRSRCRTDT
jgi:hypothetical protein